MEEPLQAWMELTLPSRGIFYPDDCAVPEGKISIRRLGVDEESIIFSPSIKPTDRIDKCIKAASKASEGSPPLQHHRLLVSDRMAIVLIQRIWTLGPEYIFTFRCRWCNEPGKATVNLQDDFNTIWPEIVADKMQDRYPERYTQESPLEHEEPFEVSLKNIGKTVQVRFLRGEDERSIVQKVQRSKSQSVDGRDRTNVFVTATQLVSVDGESFADAGSRERFVRSLDMGDRNRVRIAVDERETGIDTTLFVPCTNCGGTNETPLQYDAEFFQPSRM